MLPFEGQCKFFLPSTCSSHFWCVWCWPQASLCGSLKRRHIPWACDALMPDICLSFHCRPMTPGLQWYKFSTGLSRSSASSFRLPSTSPCLYSSSAWVIGPSGSWKKQQLSCWRRTVYWTILHYVSALGNMSLHLSHCSFSIDWSVSCITAWLWVRFAFF